MQLCMSCPSQVLFNHLFCSQVCSSLVFFARCQIVQSMEPNLQSPRAAVACLGASQEAGAQDNRAMEIKVKSLQKQLTKAMESNATAIGQANCWEAWCKKEKDKNAKLEKDNLILATEHEKLGQWAGQKPMEERFYLHTFKVAKKPSQPSQPPPQQLLMRKLHPFAKKGIQI